MFSRDERRVFAERIKGGAFDLSRPGSGSVSPSGAVGGSGPARTVWVRPCVGSGVSRPQTPAHAPVDVGHGTWMLIPVPAGGWPLSLIPALHRSVAFMRREVIKPKNYSVL